MADTSVELTKKLSSAVEKMPAFPKSVQRILELTRDVNCSPKELVMFIEYFLVAVFLCTLGINVNRTSQSELSKTIRCEPSLRRYPMQRFDQHDLRRASKKGGQKYILGKYQCG